MNYPKDELGYAELEEKFKNLEQKHRDLEEFHKKIMDYYLDQETELIVKVLKLRKEIKDLEG